MVSYIEPKNKKPEEYQAMPTEFSDKEIELLWQRINEGKTIDDVLSDTAFSRKAISAIQGINLFDHTQYIQGAYFRMLQADDVIKNIAPNDLDLVNIYVIIRFPLRGLQQRDIRVGKVALDEIEITKIYQKLGENL